MTANVTAVEWYPPDGSSKLTFSADSAYRLRDITGIDPNMATPLTRKNPSQVGETHVDVDVSPRTVSVQVQVVAQTNDELWTLRRALVRKLALSPVRVGESATLGTLRILRGELTPLELQAVPRASPQGSRRRGVSIYEADIEFLAPYPHWRETSDQARVFEADGGFEWSLEFPLESAGNDVEQEVDNAGDVDAPVLIQLYGDCTTARMINVTTDETVEIGDQIEADEYIEINTAYGQKDVVLVNTTTGARTSAMDRLNLSLADFWSLRPGPNVIRFEADANVSGSARIYWRQRFVGI